MSMREDSKVVVITGGSRNIGLAIGHALVSRGVRVAILGRGTEALQEATASLGGCQPDEHTLRPGIARSRGF